MSRKRSRPKILSDDSENGKKFIYSRSPQNTSAPLDILCMTPEQVEKLDRSVYGDITVHYNNKSRTSRNSFEAVRPNKKLQTDAVLDVLCMSPKEVQELDPAKYGDIKVKYFGCKNNVNLKNLMSSPVIDLSIFGGEQLSSEAENSNNSGELLGSSIKTSSKLKSIKSKSVHSKKKDMNSPVINWDIGKRELSTPEAVDSNNSGELLESSIKTSSRSKSIKSKSVPAKKKDMNSPVINCDNGKRELSTSEAVNSNNSGELLQSSIKTSSKIKSIKSNSVHSKKIDMNSPVINCDIVEGELSTSEVENSIKFERFAKPNSKSESIKNVSKFVTPKTPKKKGKYISKEKVLLSCNNALQKLDELDKLLVDHLADQSFADSVRTWNEYFQQSIDIKFQLEHIKDFVERPDDVEI